MQVQVNLNIPSAAAAPRGSRTHSKYVTKAAKAARRHSRPHGSVGAVARTAAAASSSGAAPATAEVTNWSQTPMPPGHVHATLQDQDWAIDDPLASRDAFYDALRIQGHPDHEHDPSIGLFDILSDIMGRDPDRLVWTREAVNNRQADFPWLTWDVAAASSDDVTTLWHGCRADVALRRAHDGYAILPGPRREKSGLKDHNKGKPYASTTANTAIAYSVPPMAQGSHGDQTLAIGPIAMFQVEANAQGVANVSTAAAPPKLAAAPKVLRVCFRLDWCTPDKRTSRIRRLIDTCAMGDCCHALHMAGLDRELSPTELDQAESWDRGIAYGRDCALLAIWPPPEALLCPRHSRVWAKAQFPPPLPLPRDLPSAQALGLDMERYLTATRVSGTPASSDHGSQPRPPWQRLQPCPIAASEQFRPTGSAPGLESSRRAASPLPGDPR